MLNRYNLFEDEDNEYDSENEDEVNSGHNTLHDLDGDEVESKNKDHENIYDHSDHK